MILASRTAHVAAAVLTAVLGGSALVGCSSDDGPTSPADFTPKGLVTPPPSALVRGTLQQVGGPAGTQPKPLSGRITFRHADGAVATTSVDESGRYAIALDPGDYTITGTSPQFQGGAVDCTTVKPVITLTVEDVTVADVLCQVR